MVNAQWLQKKGEETCFIMLWNDFGTMVLFLIAEYCKSSVWMDWASLTILQRFCYKDSALSSINMAKVGSWVGGFQEQYCQRLFWNNRVASTLYDQSWIWRTWFTINNISKYWWDKEVELLFFVLFSLRWSRFCYICFSPFWTRLFQNFAEQSIFLFFPGMFHKSIFVAKIFLTSFLLSLFLNVASATLSLLVNKTKLSCRYQYSVWNKKMFFWIVLPKKNFVRPRKKKLF